MGEPTENEAIVEEREELMVSLFADGKPNLRLAHFLKPASSSIDAPVPKLFSLHSFAPEALPFKVGFSGWRTPSKCWGFWVDVLRPRYQLIWEKAGIFEAIMSSTCAIKRYDELIIGLAEKWNPATNTFIFPWGETTISLEDVMVLGGYSVIGFPVTCSRDSHELREAEDKLLEECKKLQGGVGKRIRQKAWVQSFMGTGKDIEHEAFLSLWLTRFVLQDPLGVIRKRLFPIACLLAKGEPMALGPAVLAGIYRDLTLLKETIVAIESAEVDDSVLEVRLCSPMQLVQLWAWERFPALQPKPKAIEYHDPRSARWSNVKILKVDNVRMVLDSSGETFEWRPYARVVDNWRFHEFYKEKEEWISVDQPFSRELFSFVLCLRPSELVGLGPGSIQQYLPHRVAMQFGIDQDVPCHVARSNETPEVAWNNYLRPINGSKFYVPSRFFESDITVQYLEWWKKVSMVVQKDVIKGITRRRRSSRKRPERIPWVKPRKGENDASVPPGFPPKLASVKPEPCVDEAEPEAFEVSNKDTNVTTGPLSHDKCYVTNDQELSPSVADNGGPVKIELSITPTQKVMRIETQSSGPARVIKEVAKESESEIEFPLDDKENISRYDETRAIALDMKVSRLEARVSRIEEAFAKLKTAKRA
ncbi:hypothetical protein PTKIN_Ptkin11bG0174900 [Pterospermum kingtungense]